MVWVGIGLLPPVGSLRRPQVKHVVQLTFLPASEDAADMHDVAVVNLNGDEVFRTRLLPETTLEQVAEAVAAIYAKPLSEFRWVLPSGDVLENLGDPLVAREPTSSFLGWDPAKRECPRQTHRGNPLVELLLPTGLGDPAAHASASGRPCRLHGACSERLGARPLPALSCFPAFTLKSWFALPPC
jgi:hypothetical protein